MDEITLPTAPIVAMFTAFAAAHEDPAQRGAFETVRDLIDMGAIPTEELASIVLGRTPIESILSEAASMQEAFLDEIDDDEKPDIQTFVDDCRAAAKVFEELGRVSPA